MKSFKAYVHTKEGLIEVQAQVNPVYPTTMVYRIAPRNWTHGDIEIGMNYQSKMFTSAAKAWDDLINSDLIGRAEKARKISWERSFKARAEAVLQKCIEENNAPLYEYLTKLHEEA